MSLATFSPDGGVTLSVLSARGVLPLRGAWAWEVELDGGAEDTPAQGARSTLEIGGRSFRGYVRDVAPWHGRIRLFLEAGAAGMRTAAEAQGFESVLVSELVSRIVTDAGEILAAPLSSETVLGAWHRPAGPAAVALSAVCEASGLGWRFTDAGEVAVVVESWAEAPDVAALEIAPDGADGSTEIAPLVPSIDPGMTWRGRRIERVVYHLPEGKGLTARLHFAREGAGADLRGIFEAAVRAAVRELAYAKRWPSRVESQDAEGRLSLVPDDIAMPGTPPLPALYGLPGARAVVPQGARCGFVFEAADASRGRALGFEAETPAVELHLDASSVIALAESAGGVAGVHRIDDTGTAGALAALGAALGYVGGDGAVQWVLTGTAGATPVTWTITPVSSPADAGKLTTRALTGSQVVKAGG